MTSPAKRVNIVATSQDARRIFSPKLTKISKSYKFARSENLTRILSPRLKNSPRKPRNVKTLTLLFEQNSESVLTHSAKPNLLKTRLNTDTDSQSQLSLQNHGRNSKIRQDCDWITSDQAQGFSGNKPIGKGERNSAETGLF